MAAALDVTGNPSSVHAEGRAARALVEANRGARTKTLDTIAHLLPPVDAAFADASIDCATAAARVNALADTNADVAAANKAVFRAGHERVKAFRVEVIGAPPCPIWSPTGDRIAFGVP